MIGTNKYKRRLAVLIFIFDKVERQVHIGQALLAAIRQKYWHLRDKNIVRKVYHSYVRYFRKNLDASLQLIGNLPADCVTYVLSSFVVWIL